MCRLTQSARGNLLFYLLFQRSINGIEGSKFLGESKKTSAVSLFTENFLSSHSPPIAPLRAQDVKHFLH